MSTFRIHIEHRPIIGELKEFDFLAISASLRALPVAWNKLKLDDYHYFTPDWDDWRKIIDDLMPRQTRPYIPEQRDCEWFADWMRVMVAGDFMVNCMGRVDGWCDGARHAWNIFYDGVDWYQFEPQTGEVLNIPDATYIPDELILG